MIEDVHPVLFDVGELKPLPPQEIFVDPPKVDEPDLTEQMEFDPPVAGAILSECGTWRYSLYRKFLLYGPTLLVIGTNPSTADAKDDDNSLVRFQYFAKRDKFATLLVGNPLAFRNRSPKELRAAHKAGVDVFGPENEEHLRKMIDMADVILCSWGNAGAFLNSAQRMMEKIAMPPEKIVLCRGLTKLGHPKHLLYASNATKFVPFEWGAVAQKVDPLGELMVEEEE